MDLFFCTALGADLIGRQRPSHKVDIAYLYYLPFCMVFTSNDGLHERTTPLFLGEEQVFLHGRELKADLAKLDAHYSALPDAVKERGVMSFAHYPPTQGDFVVSTLWDKLMAPEWRKNATRSPDRRSETEAKAIIAEMKQLADAPRAAMDRQFNSEQADAVVIDRKVPIRRGKWRLLPPEASKA